MIVILVGKMDGVDVLLSFNDTAGNAGQVVCPFMEVSIIEIVFILEDVLLHALETEDQRERTKRRSYQGHGDRQIDTQPGPYSYSRLACITAYNIDVRWLGVGQCVSCVLCGPGLGEWDWDFVGVNLLALRLEDLGESQALDGLDEMDGNLSYKLCFTIGDTLYNIFELAKKILRLSCIIGSHLCKELIRFQLEHV